MNEQRPSKTIADDFAALKAYRATTISIDRGESELMRLIGVALAQVEQLDADCALLKCERDMFKQQRADWKAVADSRLQRRSDEPSSSAEERSNARRLQAYPKLAEFFNKYVLGTKLPPSCFVCGEIVIDVGVQHMELLTVQCCKRCKDAADKARHAEPPAESRLTDAACEAIIEALESCEFTGFTRGDIRLIATTIEAHRLAPTKGAGR